MRKSAEERIGEFNRFGSVLGLERMEELLDRLGHPEQRLKIIHVAGTNGKGSTCKYIYEALRANEYKVGLYSSPYIESFNERIAFDGENISDSDLERLTDIVIDACNGIIALGHDSPTEFELVTAIAFLYFAEKRADFVILEVGLGGRGDSTNVIKSPIVCAIVSIDYDHMDRLGDTLSEIAFEKAGIIKKGVPIISNVGCGAEDEAFAAYEVIRDRADEFAAPFENISNLKPSDYGLGSTIEISMRGSHQMENAKTALAVLDNLNKRGLVSLKTELVSKGMKKAKQPGRFEIVSERPFVVLDGAHNRAGALALEETVYGLDCIEQSERIIMVIGILKDKDVKGMAEIFGRIGDSFVITQIKSPRTALAEELAEQFKSVNDCCDMDRLVIEPDSKKAVQKALSQADDDTIVIVAGSLYLIGEVRGMFL